MQQPGLIWDLGVKGICLTFLLAFFFQLLWCDVITELDKLDQGFRLFPWAVWHFLFNSSVFELPSNTQSVLISAICCLLWDYEEVSLLSGLEFSCLTCLSETAGWSLSVESKFACYIFHVVAKTMVVCVNSYVWSNMAVWCGQRPKKERKKTNVEFQRWVSLVKQLLVKNEASVEETCSSSNGHLRLTRCNSGLNFTKNLEHNNSRRIFKLLPYVRGGWGLALLATSIFADLLAMLGLL